MGEKGWRFQGRPLVEKQRVPGAGAHCSCRCLTGSRPRACGQHPPKALPCPESLKNVHACYRATTAAAWGQPCARGHTHLRIQGLALWVVHRAVHAASRHRHLHRRHPAGAGAGGGRGPPNLAPQAARRAPRLPLLARPPAAAAPASRASAALPPAVAREGSRAARSPPQVALGVGMEGHGVVGCSRWGSAAVWDDSLSVPIDWSGVWPASCMRSLRRQSFDAG